MTTTHTGAASGKLPIPQRAPRGITSPAPKTVDAKTSEALALKMLPAGTIVDGVDCGGMTDDPKKPGIPVYLQTQNKRELSAEQKAKIAEAQKKAKADERAKKAERAEMAKKLGMSPTDMKKAGAPLKSEKKNAAKAAKSKRAAKPRATDGKSKYDVIAALLCRKDGCTTADVLKITGWAAVSIPPIARAAGLKLRKEKAKGKLTRYYGTAK